MTIKDRILIPFDGGFVEVKNEKVEVGDKVIGIPMKDGVNQAIKLNPIEEGDKAILIKTVDGTEYALKCENIFRIAVPSGKLRE